MNAVVSITTGESVSAAELALSAKISSLKDERTKILRTRPPNIQRAEEITEEIRKLSDRLEVATETRLLEPARKADAEAQHRRAIAAAEAEAKRAAEDNKAVEATAADLTSHLLGIYSTMQSSRSCLGPSRELRQKAWQRAISALVHKTGKMPYELSEIIGDQIVQQLRFASLR